MAKKQIPVKSFRLFAALHEDIAEGFVWLQQEGLPARGIVKIARRSNGAKSIFCEALQLEKNFLTRYNNDRERRCKIRSDDETSALVVNHWYRAKLGKPGPPLETKTDYQLEITPANSLPGRLCACVQHPQLVVRVATWLGAIGIGLGFVGALFGVVGICIAAKQDRTASSVPLVRQTAERQATPGSRAPVYRDTR